MKMIFFKLVDHLVLIGFGFGIKVMRRVYSGFSIKEGIVVLFKGFFFGFSMVDFLCFLYVFYIYLSILFYKIFNAFNLRSGFSSS